MNGRWPVLASLVPLGLHLRPAVPKTPDFTLLLANVGNVDMVEGGPCEEWPARGALCVNADEDAVRDGLATLSADILVLHEVLPKARCQGDLPADHVCSRDGESVRRLVGPTATIVCDAIGGYDCIAVDSSRFDVLGCSAGTQCVGVTPPQPDACGTFGDFSAVFAVDVRDRGTPLRLVIAHPYQAVTDEEDLCRAAQLHQALVELPGDGPTVVVGDFNMDPYRLWPLYASPNEWFAAVGAGRRFTDLHDGWILPPRTWFFDLTLDHVVADGVGGLCHVGNPLDGDRGRLDHWPLSCALTYDAATP